MVRVFKDDKSIMRDPLFKKSDFSLCHVPVPKGYPQSQTHVGVSLLNGKLILSTSPYPNPIYSTWRKYLYAVIGKLTFHKVNLFYNGEKFENPCVYLGDESLFPTNFTLLNGSPLMDCPKDRFGLGAYCSDPDLYIEEDKIFVTNRTSVRKSKTGEPKHDYETIVYIIGFSLCNGEIQKKQVTELFREQDASPCIQKSGETYYYFSLDTNSYNTGESCHALYCRKSTDILKGWSEKTKITLLKGRYEPWHMSLFKNEDTLYSIISCVEIGHPRRCWTMLGEFNKSLTELRIYQTPLTDYISYRSSAIVRDGEFVLYNATVNEKIKGGKSVDGREIIMAHRPFSQVLDLIKKYEQR